MGVVILVRHGQASFGTDDYDVLSETGWEQGRLLGAWWRDRGVTPDAVVRGGMRRHREYAEPWPAFRGRVTRSFDAARSLAGSGRTVAAVTSGGVIAALCAGLVDPD